MLSLGSERLHSLIEDTLSRPDARNAARSIGWNLYIGDEDYSDRVKGGGYVTEDGPAMVLDLDVAGMVSEMGEAVLSWTVAGIPVTAFTGELSEARYEAATGLSTLKAATGGEALERTELGERVEYGGVNPSTAIHDALLRASGYRQGLVEVDTIETPKFTRQAQDAYSATDFAADIIEGVTGENERVVIYDTATGGARAFLEPNLAAAPEPVWTFEVGVDVRRDDFEDGREDDKYREVIVRRQIEDAPPGTDPWEVLARVEVEGSRAAFGTVMRIDVSDGDLGSAFSQAHDAASAQAYRIGGISWKATYVHPLLERGDVVAVVNPGKDERGEYRERWLCVLDRAHCSEMRTKQGEYGGEGRVVATERPRVAPAPLAGLSGGVVPLSEILALLIRVDDESVRMDDESVRVDGRRIGV